MQGNLFVASFSADTVTEWDGVTGAFIGIINVDLDCPDGLRFAPNGNLWVSYVCSNWTSVMDTTGNVLYTITDAQSAPRSMAFKPGGVLPCLSLTVSTLVAGEAYLNVHTTVFGAGEIRGNLGFPVPEPSSHSLIVIGALSLFNLRRRKT